MRSVDPTYGRLGTTVFEAVSRLAAQHGAVNLGQGFPDDRGPEDVLAAAADALIHGSNQYPPMMGLPVLREAIAAHEQRFYGLTFDPQTDVLVTCGATEAIAACVFALVEAGDEVVLFQPAYDAYAPLVRRAGGTPRFVTLRPPDWSFDDADLERAFTSRTKLVVINNPLNPAGKVFTADELDRIARFVLRHDAYALCDEVYEHIVFGGARHVPFMTRDGMFARSIKLGSAGKTFSLTGWKVGLVTGPTPLIQLVAKAHQFMTFATPPNLQVAVAYGLGKDDAFFAGISTEMGRRHDRLVNGLAALGMRTLPAGGTYFVNLDIRSAGYDGDDVSFCRELVEQAGVAAIPLSAFYEEEPLRNLARFCFAKQDAVIDTAVERLGRRYGGS